MPTGSPLTDTRSPAAALAAGALPGLGALTAHASAWDTEATYIENNGQTELVGGCFDPERLPAPTQTHILAEVADPDIRHLS